MDALGILFGCLDDNWVDFSVSVAHIARYSHIQMAACTLNDHQVTSSKETRHEALGMSINTPQDTINKSPLGWIIPSTEWSQALRLHVCWVITSRRCSKLMSATYPPPEALEVPKRWWAWGLMKKFLQIAIWRFYPLKSIPFRGHPLEWTLSRGSNLPSDTLSWAWLAKGHPPRSLTRSIIPFWFGSQLEHSKNESSERNQKERW